jgi:hypothetical protein
MKPMLKASGTKRSKIKRDRLLSSFAFTFDLCCYIMEDVVGEKKPEPEKKAMDADTAKTREDGGGGSGGGGGGGGGAAPPPPPPGPPPPPAPPPPPTPPLATAAAAAAARPPTMQSAPQFPGGMSPYGHYGGPPPNFPPYGQPGGAKHTPITSSHHHTITPYTKLKTHSHYTTTTYNPSRFKVPDKKSLPVVQTSCRLPPWCTGHFSLNHGRCYSAARVHFQLRQWRQLAGCLRWLAT